MIGEQREPNPNIENKCNKTRLEKKENPVGTKGKKLQEKSHVVQILLTFPVLSLRSIILSLKN